MRARSRCRSSTALQCECDGDWTCCDGHQFARLYGGRCADCRTAARRFLRLLGTCLAKGLSIGVAVSAKDAVLAVCYSPGYGAKHALVSLQWCETGTFPASPTNFQSIACQGLFRLCEGDICDSLTQTCISLQSMFSLLTCYSHSLPCLYQCYLCLATYPSLSSLAV